MIYQTKTLRTKNKKVVKKVQHQDGEFISNIFLREKREEGNYLMILNHKHLNKYVEKKHFKMESLISALALVTQDALS